MDFPDSPSSGPSGSKLKLFPIEKRRYRDFFISLQAAATFQNTGNCAKGEKGEGKEGYFKGQKHIGFCAKGKVYHFGQVLRTPSLRCGPLGVSK